MPDSAAIFLAFKDPEFLKELFKIVVDKGLIGVLILGAGSYFTRLVERYKSAQAIIQDQQKLLYPQALKILDAADEFEELANTKLGEIDGDIAKVANQLRQVVAQHGPEIELDEQIAKEALAQTNQWNRPQIIDLRICNGKSLRDLLVEAVEDQDLKNCIARMAERRSLSDPVVPHNSSVLDVYNARERVVTALRNLKQSFRLPASVGGPPLTPFVPYRLPVNDLMVGLAYLYLNELIQPHTSQVLTAYRRLLNKAAEIPLIHWSGSENPDVDGVLLRDPEYTTLTNLGAALASDLAAYVPSEYLAQSPSATLGRFELLHYRIRLAIRRMLLPGRRYEKVRTTVVAAKAEKWVPSPPVRSDPPKGAGLH